MPRILPRLHEKLRAMTPQDAILAFVNRQLGRYPCYRALLAHAGWRVPRPVGATLPTIMVTDAELTPTIWAFSTEATYQAACAKVHEAAIGPITVAEHLDELLVEDDPRVQVLVIDPESPIAFRIQTDELRAFRMLARGTKLERAMAAADYAAARAYDRYAVPYFGELGNGHNVITIPSQRGSMVAAFATADAIDAFLAIGSESDRARVKFAIVDGETLFGEVAKMAQGVLVNPAGPRPFGFELAVCGDIAAMPRA
jgi:hypothetical protein